MVASILELSSIPFYILEFLSFTFLVMNSSLSMTPLNRSMRAIARRKKTYRALRTVHEKKKGQ